MKLADSHIHIFRDGYRHDGLPSLLGQHELETYEALMMLHDIGLALAIGYEADGIDPENNTHIRQLSASRPWLKTLAYVDPQSKAEPQFVRTLLDHGHCGLAIYVTTPARAHALLQWPRESWRALEERKAVVSFNARPDAIAMLQPLVSAFAGVSFLFSHLGLPGKIDNQSDFNAVQGRLAPVLAMAEFPNAYVKISGLYATSDPEHAYPHGGTYRVIASLIEAFGTSRCLWGSDFAPALEFVSFPQTIDWPGSNQLSETERQAIMSENLVRLVGAHGT
jgi:predicted TIM-barrel fold metal-dependent hydrolase